MADDEVTGTDGAKRQEAVRQQLAASVCDAMWAKDRASRRLGMTEIGAAPGQAHVSMTIRDDMLNAYDTCHGGLIAALADSAFGIACNTHGEMTVAAGFTIDFVAPARLGDVLTASAREVSKAGRTGVYDVDIVNQRGDRIAVFRGRAHTIKGRAAAGVELK